MSITIEAVYENGVLKPVQPLPLKDRERVQVTVQSNADAKTDPTAAERSYGIIGWKGDHETLERLRAEADELS